MSAPETELNKLRELIERLEAQAAATLARAEAGRPLQRPSLTLIQGGRDAG